MDGSSSGRGGRSGRGRGRKGKKKGIATGASGVVTPDKTVRSALHSGTKKGGTVLQSADHLSGGRAAPVATSHTLRRDDGGKMATFGPEELGHATMNKNKRKRLKKKMVGQETTTGMRKKTKTVGEATSEVLEVPSVHPRPLQTGPTIAAAAAAGDLVPIVTPHVVSLTGGKRSKKRKRHVSATCETKGGTLMAALKDGGATIESKKSLVPARPLGGSSVGQAATKLHAVGAAGMKNTVVQVRKTSTKSQAQETQKSESTTTDLISANARSVAITSATAKKVNAEVEGDAAQLGGISTSVLDKPLVSVKKLKPKAKVPEVLATTKVSKSTAAQASRAHQQPLLQLQPKSKIQQVAVVVNAFESNGPQASRDLPLFSKAGVREAADEAKAPKPTALQQPLPQADAAIATTRKCDTTTTTSLAEVAMTKKSFANSGTSPSPATIDDEFVHTRSVPSVSTTDVAELLKPSHAAVSGGCVRGKHALDETTRSEAIDTSLDTTETSSAVVVSNSSRQLASTQSVSSPSEWSQTVRHKRQLPHDLGPAISVTPFLPPSKRSAVERKVAAAAVQETRPDEVQPSADQEAAVVDHVSNHRTPNPADTAVNIPTPDVLAKTGVIAEDEPHLPVEEGSPTCQTAAKKVGDLESGNSRHLLAPSTEQMVDTMPLRQPERSLVQIQTTSSSSCRTPANGLRPSTMMKGGVSVTALSTGGESSSESAAIAVESSAKATNAGVIIDSPANVQKVMKTGLEKNRLGNACPTQAGQPTVSSASRPLNAWGASFGMVPPAHDVSSMSRTLSTTPLSSWFLSKGSANFVKQVHFSDDDADDDSSSSGEDVFLAEELLISNAVEKASFKRRALMTKKNAFLGSLLTQSHWRSWYGSVDPQNLLDPPLTHVPEKLRNHEITFFSVPEETIENDNSVSAKKTNELESLEASIRREKQKGSAFSEQLLMMLRGKTMSGKSLEEEYGSLLQ